VRLHFKKKGRRRERRRKKEGEREGKEKKLNNQPQNYYLKLVCLQYWDNSVHEVDFRVGPASFLALK
jgi:hypothetical protein